MPRREHLVLVLPGIGGTLLAPPDDPERPVWSAAPRDVGLLRSPGRLSLAEHPRLLPVGLVPTRKALRFWTPVHGYDGLLRLLSALPDAVLDDGTPGGRDPDANVVAFGYDFRLGTEDAADRLDSEVDLRLERLWPGGESHSRRLIIVAHSMGGLVARRWLGRDERNWRRCRGLITLGTPHAGAPKALDVLVNGPSVKGVHPLRNRFRPLLSPWPSMAELLPRFPVVEDLTAPPGPGGTPAVHRPHELPLPWLTGPAGAAYRLHREIERDWEALPREGPQMVARIGYGHATLRSGTWDGSRLRMTTAPPAAAELGRWADDLGDGTVPAFSGQPLETDAQQHPGLLVPQRHGPISESQEAVDWVESFEGRPRHLPVRGEERPVALGLDVGELQVAGEDIEVTAAVNGAAQTSAEGSLWAVAVPAAAGGGPVAREPDAETPLDRDSTTGRFTGRLRGLTPGLYDIQVTAEAVPGGGDLAAVATVEILDDADTD
ncbi:hypothetical protein I3F58_21565 [Streptomyces sp. MUM 203J]|uniref:esterase/lipase family protein n=1 Tax=Streptomyces sp. MUM 203J TaxID=2791990 RepID=UPI001F04B253|nr:hypothetical protein [Streptomyces sp. MUM 203J]MCH0542102.1 hypothetical protein [Streptomyces sp. MUM 203J]